MKSYRRLFTITFLIGLILIGQSQINASSGHQTNNPQFTKTFQIGRGLPTHIEWHPTQDVILVDTVIGAWLYTDQLEDITYVQYARLARFSPNGSWLAGVDDDQNITIWDGLTYEHIATLGDQSTYVTQIAWNPDNVQVAIAREDGIISVWNVYTQEQVFVTHTDPIVSLKWNPSGLILAANTPENAIYRWDFSQVYPNYGMGIAPYEIFYSDSYSVRQFDWVDDSHILRSSYTEFGYITNVELYNLDEYEPLSLLNSTGSFIWEVSPNHNLIAFGAGVYDALTLTHISSADVGDVFTIEWSPDGRLLAVSVWHYGNTTNRNKRLFVIEPLSGEVLLELAGYATNISHMAWSHDSQRLLSADRSGRIRIWDVNTGQPLRLSENHAQVNSVVEWSPDSELIAVANQMRSVNIWNISTDELQASLGPHPQPVSKIAWRPQSDFRPDAHFIATHTGGLNYRSIDGTVRIWDTDTGNLRQTILNNGYLRYEDSIVWRPDGLLLSISGGRSIKFWSMATESVWSIDSCNFGFPNSGFCPEVGEVGWSPNGEIYTFGYRDVGYAITARRFPNSTDSLGGYGVWHGHSERYGVAGWTSDSRRWLEADWQRLRRSPYPPNYSLVINTIYAEDGTEHPSIRLAGHDGFTQAVYWSPDASLLATVGEDDTTRMWDVESGEQLFVTDRLATIVWSPDSNYIAAVTNRHTITIINAQSGAIVDEWRVYDASDSDLSLTWSPDGTSIAFSSNGVLTVWTRQ